MFISITLPATHHCLACNSLFHDPEVTYERKGRYYYRRELIDDTHPANHYTRGWDGEK